MSSGAVPISFAIVGVQKAATTTLYRLLERHPQVAPTAKKELHFFDDESRDWATPDYSGYHGTRSAPDHSIAGDATPSYLFWPAALPRMRRYSPDMRLVASFRDPVERAFSQWQMEAARHPRMPPFDALVQRSLDSTEPQVPPGRWRSSRSRVRSVVARGFYGHQLARAFETYPPGDQWLLLDFDDVVRDTQSVLDRVVAHLGLSPFDGPVQVKRWKSAPEGGVDGGMPSDDEVARLATAYAEDLARFEALSGISTSRWPTRRFLDGDLDVGEWAERLRRKARGARVSG